MNVTAKSCRATAWPTASPPPAASRGGAILVGGACALIHEKTTSYPQSYTQRKFL